MHTFHLAFGLLMVLTRQEVGFRGSFLLSMESLSLHTSIQGDEIVSCVVSGAGSVTLTFHDLEDLRNKLVCGLQPLFGVFVEPFLFPPLLSIPVLCW